MGRNLHPVTLFGLKNLIVHHTSEAFCQAVLQEVEIKYHKKSNLLAVNTVDELKRYFIKHITKCRQTIPPCDVSNLAFLLEDLLCLGTTAPNSEAKKLLEEIKKPVSLLVQDVDTTVIKDEGHDDLQFFKPVKGDEKALRAFSTLIYSFVKRNSDDRYSN